MSNLEKLCREFRNTGLYTHVYVACGYLEDTRNLFEFSDVTPAEENRTIFDLSSLTKALMTTPIVLWMCRENNLDPKSTKLAECFESVVLKELGLFDSSLTIADFLRHETGLPAWRNFYVSCENKRQTLRDVLVRTELTSNKTDVYSDVGFLVLTHLIESSKQKNIYNVWLDYCQKYKIQINPDLVSALFVDKTKAISTGYCPVRQRELIGEVHDENCFALGGMTGHSGLFGSGSSVSSYLRNLWQSSEGQYVFQSNFDEVNSKGESLMGWRKGRDQSSRSYAEGRGCGHMGFTGTAFWVDSVSLSYAVVLTNRIISARVSPAIKDFRSQTFAELWDIIKNNPK